MEFSDGREPDVHQLHMDAPIGSPVIQTSSQYKYCKENEEEIETEYKKHVLNKVKSKVLSFNTLEIKESVEG